MDPNEAVRLALGVSIVSMLHTATLYLYAISFNVHYVCTELYSCAPRFTYRLAIVRKRHNVVTRSRGLRVSLSFCALVGRPPKPQHAGHTAVKGAKSERATRPSTSPYRTKAAASLPSTPRLAEAARDTV